MPIRRDVPIGSRAALEAWIREKASDPAIFAKLQTDFRAAIEELIGERLPADLDVQLYVEEPGETFHVHQFGGGVVKSDGSTVSQPPTALRAMPIADPALAPAAGKVTVLQETTSKRFFVLPRP